MRCASPAGPARALSLQYLLDALDEVLGQRGAAVQVGVGVPSGQGSNPVVMLSLSPDGGESWGAEYQVGIGQGGRYQTRVEWYHLESFYTGVIKIRFSDPVFVGIFSAAIDIDLAGY